MLGKPVGISNVWDVKRPDDERVLELASELVRTQEELHQLLRVAAEQRRPGASETIVARGVFQGGDHESVARSHKVLKLMFTWTGPWRGVMHLERVHVVEDVVSGHYAQIHVAECVRSLPHH